MYANPAERLADVESAGWAHPVPGQTLPNGAYVIAVRETGRRSDGAPLGVVLAMCGGGRWPVEYATWLYVTDERGTVTVSGRYHPDIAPAVTDLLART
jgi:hypothetical protein